MAFTFGFYNSINHDRKYDAVQISSIFDGIITDGVYMTIGTSFMVTEAQDLTVNVGIGRAWFNHTWNYNDSILPIKLDAPEVILDRIDAIVLDIYSDESVRENSIKVIKGTPATNPVEPILIKDRKHNQYPLAYILVKRNTEQITQAEITNKVGTSDCPFVTGVLTGMDIDALIAQWGAQWEDWTQKTEETTVELINSWSDYWNNWMSNTDKNWSEWTAETETSWNEWFSNADSNFDEYKANREEAFNSWFQTIKDQLSEDAAGNLENQIIELNDKNEYLGEILISKVEYETLSSVLNAFVLENSGRRSRHGDIIKVICDELNKSELWFCRIESYEPNWAFFGEGRMRIPDMYIDTVILHSQWNGNEYSFESEYPSDKYDLYPTPSEIISKDELEAWNDAQMLASKSNILKAFGRVPIMDIPILLKVVTK